MNSSNSLKISEKNKDFFLTVHEVVKLVPKGRVTTYGAIAKYLGSPRSSRMVGWAMNAAAKNADIPAHRVVNRNGLLTGKHHFSTAKKMEELLNAEGIKVVDDKVIDFQQLLWEPTTELDF